MGSSRAFVANPWVGHTFVRNSLHASFAVCGSPVKQVSHSWHIVLDTIILYTFLNFFTQFFSLLNLHLETELIIVNINLEYIHSVYRSLEIHNCALTSSSLPQKKRVGQLAATEHQHAQHTHTDTDVGTADHRPRNRQCTCSVAFYPSDTLDRRRDNIWPEYCRTENGVYKETPRWFARGQRLNQNVHEGRNLSRLQRAHVPKSCTTSPKWWKLKIYRGDCIGARR